MFYHLRTREQLTDVDQILYPKSWLFRSVHFMVLISEQQNLKFVDWQPRTNTENAWELLGCAHISLLACVCNVCKYQNTHDLT
jgi:hypothetical protein